MGRVVVLVWKQAPTVEGVEETRRLFRAVLMRAPKDKLAFVTVIEAEATALNIPTNVRDALSGMLKELDKHIVAATVVVDAEGFRASLVRTFVATMNLANRLEFPSNTDKSVDSATRWLAARDKAFPVDADALADAIKRLRARPPTRSGGAKASAR